MTDNARAEQHTTGKAAVRIGWVGIAVAVAFGLFYAYDLFEAISNVVGVVTQINAENGMRKAVGLTIIAIPWALLIVDLALAPVAYAAAFFLGRRRPLLARSALFLVGLTAVAAMSTSLVSFA